LEEAAMAGITNGGGKVISLRLQYFCVLAAVVVAVMVLSLALTSPAAMVAVRENLGSVAAAGNNTASGAVGGGATTAAAEEQERRPPVVLFNFGDSNSDTGGVAAAGGIRIMPPEGRTYFHHPTGRLSDGRVIIDFFCEFNQSTTTDFFRRSVTFFFFLPCYDLQISRGLNCTRKPTGCLVELQCCLSIANY
jgi:hypothetical protein